MTVQELVDVCKQNAIKRININSEHNTSRDIARWLDCWFCPFDEECENKSDLPADELCDYFVDKYVDTPDKNNK